MAKGEKRLNEIDPLKGASPQEVVKRFITTYWLIWRIIYVVHKRLNKWQYLVAVEALANDNKKKVNEKAVRCQLPRKKGVNIQQNYYQLDE